MSLPSSELFRFAVGRAPRPADRTRVAVLPPARISFVALALQRAEATPHPALVDVARDFLGGKDAVRLAVADTPWLAATEDAHRRLETIGGGGGSRADASAAIDAAGLAAARGSADRARVIDSLWSTLCALHCAPIADGGAVLRLSRAIRVHAVESDLGATGAFDLHFLLRAPLRLPLSAIRDRYPRRPGTVPADARPPAHELLDRQRAEAQRLVGLQHALDRLRRIERSRDSAPTPPKDPSAPLTPTELRLLDAAYEKLLAELGVLRARMPVLMAETDSAVRSQAMRVSRIGQKRAAPPVPLLRTRRQLASETRGALLQLSMASLHDALGTSLLLPGVIDLFEPDVVPLPGGDALVEGLLPRIRPFGVLDLKLVETRVKRYQLGELAHIENVLASEFRERVHKRQDTREETTLLETQSRRENERSLESTERFELKREVSTTIQEQLQFNAGVQVSVNGPSFSVGASAGFSYGRSSEEAEKFSSNYSKEIVDKAREKVETQVREQRQTLRRLVIDEANTHRFDNTGGDSRHKVGVYRYVDKVLEARRVNYGRRMMFEFMVPEPGAAIRAVERQASAKPAPLPELTIGPADLDESNYQHHAGLYGAREIEPPPPVSSEVSALLIRDSSSPPGDGSAANPVLLSAHIDLPSGYAAQSFRISLQSVGDSDPVVMAWSVGDAFTSVGTGLVLRGSWMSPRRRFDTPRLSPKIAAWLLIGSTRQAVASVTLECARLPARWEAWQNATYAKIKEAYEIRLADVLEGNRRLESQLRRGVGTVHAASNRRRERDELTRGCVTAIHSMLLQGDFFDSLRVTDTGGVVVDVDDALREGQAVRFLEGAFEWEQMTYLLYPYFWGNRERWPEMMLASHEDPKFEQFLRSGFARVMVPVVPGQETNVLNFLTLGLPAVFDGVREAVFDDDVFVDLLADLDEPLDPPRQEGEPWEVVVPTTLVKLQLEGEEDVLGIRGTA